MDAFHKIATFLAVTVVYLLASISIPIMLFITWSAFFGY